MTSSRKKYSAEEKAKIALEAIKGELTQAQLSSRYGVHATQIQSWKRQLLASLPDVFSDKRDKANRDQDSLVNDLYSQIGQLTVEVNWLKKKSTLFSGKYARNDRSI